MPAPLVWHKVSHAEFPTLAVVHAEAPTQARRPTFVHAVLPTLAGPHNAEFPTYKAVFHAEKPTHSYNKVYNTFLYTLKVGTSAYADRKA